MQDETARYKPLLEFIQEEGKAGNMSADLLKRYARQTVLPQVGMLGQNELARARVLCVGMGGLGCSVVTHLASAGVGTIGVMDGDDVDESNLQRQFLFGSHHVGQSKVRVAKEVMESNGVTSSILDIPDFITDMNAASIISEFDLVVDATDRSDAKVLINQECLRAKKPLVFGTVNRFEGRVSVFSFQNGPCYMCLFPNGAELELLTCSEAGVLGAAVGVVGSLQSLEAIKVILARNKPELSRNVLSGKLLVCDLLRSEFRTLSLSPLATCSCRLK